MTDPEPSRPLASLRLAAAPANDATAETLLAQGPLRRMLEALRALGPEPDAIAAILRQRLGDARTLALLAQGDTAPAAGALMARAALASAGAIGQSLAEKPDDASGRLACVRAQLRFGEVLLAQGVVAPRRLEAALESQKATGRRIGEELAAESHISTREVAEALWLQHKLAACALAVLLLPPARGAAVPRLVHSTQ